MARSSDWIQCVAERRGEESPQTNRGTMLERRQHAWSAMVTFGGLSQAVVAAATPRSAVRSVKSAVRALFTRLDLCRRATTWFFGMERFREADV